VNRPRRRMKEIVRAAAELKSMKKALYARAVACSGKGPGAEVFRVLHDVEDKLLSVFQSKIEEIESGAESVVMDCSFAAESDTPSLRSALSAWSAEAEVTPEAILAIENAIHLGHLSISFCTISLGESETPAERKFLAVLLACEQGQFDLLCRLRSYLATRQDEAAATLN
jgi:hypothetical protein